jgi:hypothetical protein
MTEEQAGGASQAAIHSEQMKKSCKKNTLAHNLKKEIEAWTNHQAANGQELSEKVDSDHRQYNDNLFKRTRKYQR